MYVEIVKTTTVFNRWLVVLVRTYELLVYKWTVHTIDLETGKEVGVVKKSVNHFEVATENYNRTIKLLQEQNKCPLCSDGYIAQKTGKYGFFYGCSNYPQCDATFNEKGQPTKKTKEKMNETKEKEKKEKKKSINKKKKRSYTPLMLLDNMDFDE